MAGIYVFEKFNEIRRQDVCCTKYSLHSSIHTRIPPYTLYFYRGYYYTIRDAISTGSRKYRIVNTTKRDFYRRLSIDIYCYYYYTQNIVFIVIFLCISTGCLAVFFKPRRIYPKSSHHKNELSHKYRTFLSASCQNFKCHIVHRF